MDMGESCVRGLGGRTTVLWKTVRATQRQGIVPLVTPATGGAPEGWVCLGRERVACGSTVSRTARRCGLCSLYRFTALGQEERTIMSSDQIVLFPGVRWIRTPLGRFAVTVTVLVISLAATWLINS